MRLKILITVAMMAGPAMAILEHLAADGIEHHVRAPPVGDPLDGIAKRLAIVADEVIGAPRLRNRQLLVA